MLKLIFEHFSRKPILFHSCGIAGTKEQETWIQVQNEEETYSYN